MHRFLLLTNIPAPYRIAFFNTLAGEMAAHAIGLRVVYCAETEPNRHWAINLVDQRYQWTILRGLHASLGPRFIHVNPGVVSLIRKWSPHWLLIGGAWHLPTMWLASRRVFAPNAARILWTEGHADAVLNRRGPIAALRRRAFRSFDAFAVPNARSAEFACSEAGRPLPILPLANTVDEDFYHPPAGLDRRALRESLGIAPGLRVVVSVAQLTDRKGVVELARAYGTLPAHIRRGSLLAFLGDGDQRQTLTAAGRAAAPGEIRLLGHVSGETVRSWLWAADIFCLATRLDPNPLSPIEASFAGLPLLLSSNAGNVNELVREGETGWRLESIEEGVIRESLSIALSADQDQIRRMGRAAHENADQSFRRSSVARRFVSALLDLFPA